MVDNVRVTIYPSQVQLNFEQSVSKDAEKVGADAVVQSKARLVPGRGYRTGTLSNSITFGRQPIGRYLYRIRLNAAAKHAAWVEHGTASPILPKNGPYLAVGKREGKFNGGRGVPKRSVSGQAAQKYLEHGMNAALHAAGYGSVFD